MTVCCCFCLSSHHSAWSFIFIFTAGNHNMNGSYYMIIVARTQVSEIMHAKELVQVKKKQVGRWTLSLRGLLSNRKYIWEWMIEVGEKEEMAIWQWDSVGNHGVSFFSDELKRKGFGGMLGKRLALMDSGWCRLHRTGIKWHGTVLDLFVYMCLYTHLAYLQIIYHSICNFNFTL